MDSASLMWIATVAVCAYYLIVWLAEGRDPKPGTVVVQYEPPANLSPAMLRFLWKEHFDDRVFWAGLLSLVSKGFARLDVKDSLTTVHAVSGRHQQSLPKEELFLLDKVLPRCGPGGLSTHLVDDDTARYAWGMAAVLRNAAVGRWFQENRDRVLIGSALSFFPVFFSAHVQSLSELLLLAYGLIFMAPAAFYAAIMVPHLLEPIRACRKNPTPAVLRRTLALLAPVTVCVASLVVGAILLGVSFGAGVLLVAIAMAALNLTFLHLMKAPTEEGRRLLDGIEGFRQFLASVEQYPMDRPDSPAPNPGTYERYLPYAVALEVEQEWSQKFLVLAESLPEWEFWRGSFFFVGPFTLGNPDSGEFLQLNLSDRTRGASQ